MNYKFGCLYKKQTAIFCAFILSVFLMKNLTSSTENKMNFNALKNHNDLMSMDVNNLEKLTMIFPKSVQEINDWTTSAIDLIHQEVDQILAVQNPTFENTMRALDISFNKFGNYVSILATLNNVHPDTTIRDTALAAEKTLREVAIDLSMNAELYQLIQNYYDNYSQKEKLTSEDKLLITDYLKACKRKGLHLPATVLEQAKKIAKEISALEQDFSVTINNDDTSIQATKEELLGVNENFIKSLEKDGDAYIVPCKLSTFLPVITECSVEATRKRIFFARSNIAYPQNEMLLTQLLKKRHEFATLLGYPSFASLDLEQTSAKNITNIQNFLTPLAETCLKKIDQEFAQLKNDLPEGIQLQKNNTFNQWDYPYVYTQYKKKYFSIDESAIAEYFPVQKVIDGIFIIYQNFLGLTFKKVTPQWSWHEDVMLIEIYRQSSQELLGYLFLDLYPRANKFSHACVQPIIASHNNDHKNITSVATLITNFPKPSADAPALLKHSDVVTFFHEFGHAMHNVLSRTQHPGQAGLNVALDFVETPSQMFEQWMYEPEMLSLVSGHYKTHEPLPKEIIEKKIKLRQANSGHTTLRQCMIGLFALQSMSNNDLSYNPALLWKSLDQKYLSKFMKYEDNNHWFTTFGHLASDTYASKYYSYLWTEVFALDLFASIKKNNFNPEYSQKVIKLLSAGASVEPEILLEEFLGRKPNQTAFLSVLGLE